MSMVPPCNRDDRSDASSARQSHTVATKGCFLYGHQPPRYSCEEVWNHSSSPWLDFAEDLTSSRA